MISFLRATSLAAVGTLVLGASGPHRWPGVSGDQYTITIDDLINPAGPGPGVYLSLKTVRQLGCVGIPIEATVTRRGDTILLDVRGIKNDIEVCAAAMGPATFWQRLDVTPGQYTLTIRDARRRATYTLTVTDTSLALAGSKTGLVVPDTRMKWRVPPRSFALACGAGRSSPEEIAPLCADVVGWLRQLPGVSAVAFPAGGVNPYYEGADSSAFHFFKYQDSTVLPRLQACLGAIRDQIRTAVGVSLTIQRWDGVRWTAWSERAFHESHIPVPATVTGVPACARP